MVFGRGKLFRRNIELSFSKKGDKLKRIIAGEFDAKFYIERYPDISTSLLSPLDHFLEFGRAEGRCPRSDFEPTYYSRQHAEELAGCDPFAHWIVNGKAKGYVGHPWVSRPDIDDLSLMRAQFDELYYARSNPDVVKQGFPLFFHFLSHGWRDGRNPNEWFSVTDYLEMNEEVKAAGLNPFSHYVVIGKGENRLPRKPRHPSIAMDIDDPFVYSVVESGLDPDFYRTQFGENLAVPADPVAHFISVGWKQGLDPNSHFHTSGYLAANPDVVTAGVNPFFHYLVQGQSEGRGNGFQEIGASAAPPLGNIPEGKHLAADVFGEHLNYASRGDSWEDFDPSITLGRARKAKILAYYLPQFHPIPENDAWWGAGFTEWRNVVRGQPRFKGHFQPRVPGELGFYDLRYTNVIRDQVELAKAAGIYGFCFYYYSFNGDRILERPIENFLAATDIDFPFALIWANENWTRTWDGLDRSILLEQKYRIDDEGKFLSDIARHFSDRRYIRINGRPIFFIYRPGNIPHSKITIERWRRILAKQHGVSPLMFMCQGFNDFDPRPHGLDGALEFPPHKVCVDLPAQNAAMALLDPKFSGHVISYDATIKRSTEESAPDFPLIKAATPSWDNEARRPGRGMVLQGSTPQKYEDWLRKLVAYAESHPVFGEPFVGVNAWNEWAEGAYLEPDVYYGAAYLNATARAAVGAPLKREVMKHKVLLVGHDAYKHGAQLLLRNIGEVMTFQFGMDPLFIICGEGPLLEEYRRLGPCETLAQGDMNGAEQLCRRLANAGYLHAIVNTTVNGWIVPVLKTAGVSVTTLVHELPTFIKERSLEHEARTIVRESDLVVFPASVVRDSFLEIAGGEPASHIHVQPQGLYRTELLKASRDKKIVRKQLGISERAKVVINVGYADMRKGFDIFVKIAYDVCMTHDDFYFIWVGDGTDEVRHWLLPHFARNKLKNRIRLTGYTDEVERYYAIADLFFLSSREDPFPSVIIEALAAGLPIIGFEGSGGAADLLTRHGRLLDQHNDREIARAIVQDVQSPEQDQASSRRKKYVDEFLRFDSYCHDLASGLFKSLPSVSVILPNYNYARYLEARLESIFRQTMPIFELIVLDDCSTDASLKTIKSYSERRRRRITLVPNDENSGSVFKQWRKGVELARGDYLWIAEADDDSDARFLQFVLDGMLRCDAALGFSDSWQIGSNDELLGESYKPYVNQLVPAAFDSSFGMKGREFMAKFLSVKNVILNVSSVVFRRRDLLDALNIAGSALYDYKVAGDWRLYAEVCSGDAMVTYEARPLNGHRRHQSSVTHSLNKEKHYWEIVEMQNLVANRVNISEELKKVRSDYLDEVRVVLNVDQEGADVATYHSIDQ
jgi:glycosyltransferase involved in cell wall biosynthesis